MIADSPWESHPYFKIVIIINLCIKQNMLGPLGKMTTNNAKLISQSYILKGDHGIVECTFVLYSFFKGRLPSIICIYIHIFFLYISIKKNHNTNYNTYKITHYNTTRTIPRGASDYDYPGTLEIQN